MKLTAHTLDLKIRGIRIAYKEGSITAAQRADRLRDLVDALRADGLVTLINALPDDTTAEITPIVPIDEVAAKLRADRIA